MRVLRYMLDENEFLSPFGIRSLSKRYGTEPYVFRCGSQEFRVQYLPGESDSGMFGGNSNWRGPIWFPLNYLLIEALARFYGEQLKVESPTGSGRWMTLDEVARELAGRLLKLFRKDGERAKAVSGEARGLSRFSPIARSQVQAKNATGAENGTVRLNAGIACDEPLLFYEYFDAETGRGLGASHQTGWTSLVANCLETCSK